MHLQCEENRLINRFNINIFRCKLFSLAGLKMYDDGYICIYSPDELFEK